MLASLSCRKSFFSNRRLVSITDVAQRRRLNQAVGGGFVVLRLDWMLDVVPVYSSVLNTCRRAVGLIL